MPDAAAPLLFEWQAEAARRELAAWERNGPLAVADRRMDQADLDFNLAAWRAIAQLMATGKCEETTLTWADLHRATAACLKRRREAIDANQDPDRHRALVERHQLVLSIHARIARNRDAAYRAQPHDREAEAQAA